MREITLVEQLTVTAKPDGQKYAMASTPIVVKQKLPAATHQKLQQVLATRTGLSSKYYGDQFAAKTNYDDPALRNRITCRVREEVEINAYMDSILGIRQVSVYGAVPRVKFSPNGNPKAAAELTQAYNDWARVAKKGRKLRLLGLHHDRDGDAGAILKQNSKIKHAVKLDIQGVEHDQIGADARSRTAPGEFDGVVHDLEGNVTHYRVRRSVVTRNGTVLAKSDLVPEMFFIHAWNQKRFRQQRGTSPMKSVVHLGESLREYRSSSLKQLDKASKIAGVITGSGESDCSIETGEVLEIEEGGFLCINSDDATVTSFETNQKVQDLVQFTGTGVAEMGRALKQPKSQSLGSYADENFASGKMGRIDSQMCIAVDRYDLACEQLDKILLVWLLMAYRAKHNFGEDFLSEEAKEYLAKYIFSEPSQLPPHTWQYDKTPEVDPQKYAKSNELKLATGQTSLSEIHAANGDCWLGAGGVLEQFAEDLGLSTTDIQTKICSRLWEYGLEVLEQRRSQTGTTGAVEEPVNA